MEEKQRPCNMTCPENTDSKYTSVVLNLETHLITHYKKFPSFQMSGLVVIITSHKSAAFNDPNTNQITMLWHFMKLVQML